MAGVSTRSLAVRALLALLLVSGSLMHVLAKETHDEKDGPAINSLDGFFCSNYATQDPPGDDPRLPCRFPYNHCELQCNLDFQDCLANQPDCTSLYAAPSL